MEKIDIGFIPKEDMREGILVEFNRDTPTEHPFAKADIYEGQRYYEYPKDERQIKAVYLKLLTL